METPAARPAEAIVINDDVKKPWASARYAAP
jgi:hypothetical protein